MSSKTCTFEERLDHCSRLLAQNPGKALVLGGNTVALLDVSGSICCALFDDRSGLIDHCSKFKLTADFLRDEAIGTPRFIDLSFLPSGPDPLLSVLEGNLLQIVEAALFNDDESLNDELHAYFIESGFTAAQAERALAFRNRYMGQIYRIGDTPILKGDDASHFDPRASRFVRDGG